jgi:hypothetical protein
MSTPARGLAFVQVVVFTDRVFVGNPLAVFLDGVGLTADRMQAIAREMNLSETVFLLPTATTATSVSASSPPAASCHSPATPPSAPRGSSASTALTRRATAGSRSRRAWDPCPSASTAT